MPFTGVADLPLHGGHVPRWLAEYMKRLARAIVAAVVELYSPRRLVELLADPVWFQAFNNAIGMDWDSSGSTTVTIGILKQVALAEPELGIVVAGGKGARSRQTPEELTKAAEEGRIPDRLAEEAKLASRIAAKTDNVLLQDGYTLYHHAVVVSADGAWTIVQQGMNASTRMARRYHWLSPLGNPPSLEPHTGIASTRREQGVALDLTSRKSGEARRAIPEIIMSTSPGRLVEEILAAYRALKGLRGLDEWIGGPRLAVGRKRIQVLARYYRPQERPPRDIGRKLQLIRDYAPRSIDDLALIEGVGPSTVRSLALVAELVYGVPVSHEDPASAPIDPFRYAYVAGGKDGVPYPFKPHHAEAVIRFLESVVREARIDEKSRRQVLARIERMARLLPR